ncbi:MAG: hypothetical protein JSS53_10625, partial [Proteobacteria bacterium]|nr:hypothetical protein [Pseudomonadota bacterium]
KRLLEKAKFWDGFKKSLFKTPIQEKYAKDFYQEAHSYLKQAEEHGYPLAIRLVGLSYINGWGFAVDQDKGFQLVVDSIEREGSWDRATQIFTELGLNKSEFFSSIMSMRKAKR